MPSIAQDKQDENFLAQNCKENPFLLPAAIMRVNLTSQQIIREICGSKHPPSVRQMLSRHGQVKGRIWKTHMPGE